MIAVERVYLDTNVFIMLSEKNHRLQQLLVQMISAQPFGKPPKFATSELTLSELLVKPHQAGERHNRVYNLIEGFLNGLRFDLRVVVYLSIPLLLAILSARAMAARGLFRVWLTLASSVVMLLGRMEVDFYRVFLQRLNGLGFE